MPEDFHKLLFLFFSHCYKQQQIPSSWKISLTILLYKKGDPSHLTNHRPIALANTIYKLFTNTLTFILSAYGEEHQILHDSQEGFRAERSTSRQLQLLIATLEDARFTNQNIYILYIDFKNAFGSLDHARLLAIIKDLGYPEHAVTLIGNIYSQSNTIFTGEHFGRTKPIPIQRGTIQGDTLSPYLFLIFLEPLLRWLQRGRNGYTLGTSKLTISSAAYADDLAIITNNLQSIQTQLNKLDKYCEWAGMDLGVPKCAITGCPNKSNIRPNTFKAKIQTQNITYRNQPIPILHQNEPYVYLGIQLVPSLKWQLQTHITTTKIINQCKQLSTCPATIKQKMKMVDTVIRAGIAYSFYAVPYSLPSIKKLDKKIIGIQKTICGLPKCTANVITQLPHDLFGLEAFSLKNAYLRCISEQLRNALNDKGRLGIIYKGLIQHILSKHGGAKEIPRIKYQDCIRSPTTRTLFLMKTEGEVHLKSIEANFHLHQTELEKEWKTTTELPHLNPKLSLKLLHKLMTLNIHTIKQISLPNGTNLMSPEDFKIYYKTPTKLEISALKIATQLFCNPTCNQNCPTPCPIHIQTRTLKTQYISENRELLPRIVERPIHYTPPQQPQYPSPPTNIINNPNKFPIEIIISHKLKKTKDKYKIIKNFNTYLCQWTLRDQTIYNKWMPQRELFPFNMPLVISHNINRLTEYYTQYQHRYYKSILIHTLPPYKTKTQDPYHQPK